jgi:hypothetical protein
MRKGLELYVLVIFTSLVRQRGNLTLRTFEFPLWNLWIYLEFLQFLHGKCTIYMKEADEFSVLESSSVDGDLLHCVRCKNSTMNE